MKRAGLFALCAFLLALSCPAIAQATSDPALEPGLRLLEQGRTFLGDQPLADAHDAFTKLIQQHPENALYFYERARANAYRADAFAAHGDHKKMSQALDEGISDAQKSLALNEKSADTHSLLADLYGRKIGMEGGLFAGPRFGPKVTAENKRALELDANNPRVHASLGRAYLETPKMFGGDLDKAVESFRKSIQLDPKDDATYVWLAMALRRKGDQVGAEQALKQALQLNPQSVFAKQTAQEK